MDDHYLQILTNMESTLRTLESRVPAPKLVEHGNGRVFRYTERSIHQAIIQKLARIISGLHAARILLAYGYVQN